MAQSAVEQNPALRTLTLYGHPVLTDSLLCPWEKKALTFSLNSTRLIRYPVNTDTMAGINGLWLFGLSRFGGRWGGVSTHNSRALSLSISFLRAWSSTLKLLTHLINRFVCTYQKVYVMLLLFGLPADVLWGSFVTHSFLPHGPWGRNECVTNEPQRTSAGRVIVVVMLYHSASFQCTILTIRKL